MRGVKLNSSEARARGGGRGAYASPSPSTSIRLPLPAPDGDVIHMQAFHRHFYPCWGPRMWRTEHS